MQIRHRVLISALEGWGTTKQKTEEGWWQKCSSNSGRCTTVGLCITEQRAAGIFTDFTEELREEHAWCLLVSTSYDEWSAMVKTGDEWQLTAYMSLHGNICCDSLLRRSVVPAKFLLVPYNLSDEHETYNAFLVEWSGRRSTLRAAKHDTWHGTVWARTHETHWHLILTAVCIKPRKECCTHPCIEHVTLCCLLASNAQLIVLSEPSLLARAQKSWDQFDEYDSQKLPCVKQTSEKTKVHRWIKYRSKIRISAVNTLWNLRIGLKRRPKDKSDAPAETHGDLPRIFQLEEKEKATFFSPFDEWILPAASTIKPGEENFVEDSGASMQMVSRKDFNSAEWESVRVSWSPTTVITTNGEVLTKEEATVYVRELDLFVTVMFLGDIPPVLSLGNLCDDHGFNYLRTSGQTPHLINNGKKIECNTANCVPFVVPSLWTSSSRQAHLHLHLLHLHRRKPWLPRSIPHQQVRV